MRLFRLETRPVLTIARIMAARPTVQIPAPAADRPSWLRVGAVALVGFAIGVAWPKLAGVRIGPTAPAEAVSAVAAARAAEIASAAAASASAAAPVPPPPPIASAATTINVTASHAGILSCKTEDGDVLKGKDCGGLAGLDQLVQARLKRLAQFPAAAENLGKLNVILGLDFKNNRISVESGKSSTVKDVESLKAFVAGEVKSMSLKSVDHTNERYSVVYVVNISNGAPAAASSTPSTSTTPTSAPASDLPEGMAAVAWETAIVRDAPHTGAIVAHLPRGTKVKLGTSDGGWYKIQFGPTYASEGFVYRGAIGK
jgi:hypothetical protein